MGVVMHISELFKVTLKHNTMPCGASDRRQTGRSTEPSCLERRPLPCSKTASPNGSYPCTFEVYLVCQNFHGVETSGRS